MGTALCLNEASVVVQEQIYVTRRNYPIETIIQDTSAEACSNKNFVERDLLKPCMVVPISVTLESIK